MPKPLSPPSPYQVSFLGNLSKKTDYFAVSELEVYGRNCICPTRSGRKLRSLNPTSFVVFFCAAWKFHIVLGARQ